jgi:hypothetical protein
MPEPNSSATAPVANSEKYAVEKRTTNNEIDQQQTQEARLREQSFESARASQPEPAEQKRKRMEISL